MTDYALAITHLVETNYFAGVALRHNGAIATNYAELYIENDDTGLSVKPDENTLVTAHTAQVAIEATKQADTQARTISNADVRKYLFNQLVSASPSVPTIYTNVKPFIDSNVKLLNAVTNTIALYNLADGTTTDLATNAGKARYLRAVLHVLALFG